MFTELWADIEKHFNFENVKKVMDFTEWKWHGMQPTIEEIESEAMRLCEGAFNSCLGKGVTESTHSCGGFEAYYSKPRNKLELKFVLEEWETPTESEDE